MMSCAEGGARVQRNDCGETPHAMNASPAAAGGQCRRPYEGLPTGNHVGMPCIESPRASLSLPDVGKASVGGLTSLESEARSIAQWHQSLETHDEREVAIRTTELDLSLEGRE